MRRFGIWLLGVAVLSLSCTEDPGEPPPSEPPSSKPENCRDVPSDYDVLESTGSYVRLTCSWAVGTLTWSCSGGRMGPNWAVSESASARYLSESDFVAERTPGVVRAVENWYEWSSSKAGSVSEHAQYTYDGQQRLVSKTVKYTDAVNPFEPQHQDQVYTFTSWDELGRPLAGEYTSKWTKKDGTELSPSCSDTFTLSYDDAAGHITRTAGAQGCAGLAFSFSAEEFGVNELGEKLLFSPRSVAVHDTQRFCAPE